MGLPLDRSIAATLLAAAVVLAASGAADAAQARRAVAPRGAPPRRVTAPGPSRAVAYRAPASRGYVAPRQTASGVARYGYGSPGYAYPWWGGGSYWGEPWYGWPYYGWPYCGSLYFDWSYYGGGFAPTYVLMETPPGPSVPAIVETDISPSKAAVVLDGTPIGFAKDFNGRWDELRIEPGRHTLTFRKDGYRSLTVRFDALAGGRYLFEQQLARGEGEETIDRTAQEVAVPPPARPVAGFLRLDVLPGDAGVYLDGDYLGTGAELAALHGSIPVARGDHTIEVVRPGFKGETRTVLVEADGSVHVELRLEPSSH